MSLKSIGILAGGILLLLLIVALVVRATRNALSRADSASVEPVVAPRAPEQPTVPLPAALVPAGLVATTIEQRASDAEAHEPSVPVTVNGSAPPPPASEAVAVTLWRGYTKARFMARSGSNGTGAVVATSAPFKWRNGRAQQSEDVIRAHVELLAKLASSGWRADEQTLGRYWYDVVLHRTAGTVAPAQEERPPDEVPVLAPQ